MSFKNNGFSLFLGQRRHKIFCIFHIKGNDRKFDGSGGKSTKRTMVQIVFPIIIMSSYIFVPFTSMLIHKKKIMLQYKSITKVKSRTFLSAHMKTIYQFLYGTKNEFSHSYIFILSGTQRKTCHFMCVIEPGNNLHL